MQQQKEKKNLFTKLANINIYIYIYISIKQQYPLSPKPIYFSEGQIHQFT